MMTSPSVRAWFTVGGFSCAPEEAAALLGITPDDVWRAGEGIGAARTPQPQAGVRVRSALGPDADVEAHAAWLLDRLPARLEVQRLEGDPWAQLSFAIYMADQAPAISLSAEILARIAALGASVDVDLYPGAVAPAAGGPITREEFARAVEAFLGELGVLCIGETEASLRRLPDFIDHYREVVAALRHPATAADEVLGTACGLVDEYVGANREQVLDEAYRFYLDQHGG